MKREQISTFLNSAIAEVVGESEIIKEDLSNIVTVGSAIPTASLDAVFSKIIDKIGNTKIISKEYEGSPLGLMVDEWTFGSILEKIRIDLPETTDNKAWSLVKGESYDCFKFSPPTVRAKYFEKAVTFEIEMSFTSIQMRDSFRNAETSLAFWNAVESAVQKSIKANTELLEYRALINMIGLKIHNNNNVINLLSEYKTATGDSTITAAKALSSPDFLRFAGKTISQYKDYIRKLSMLFNDDGYITNTLTADERLILLTDFDKSLKFNLMSGVFNKEFIDIGVYTSVPSWQGFGTSVSFENNSKIDLTVKNLNGENVPVTKTGIVGVLFDSNACCICRRNFRTLSMPVPKGEFINYWYKFDGMYINDTAENFIVFTIED